MSKVIFIVAVAAFTFSLVLSASAQKDGKEGMNKMPDALSEKDAEEAMKMFNQTMKDCNETFTIQTEYLASLYESGSFPDETDRTPKCYVRCILEKTGVATEDGVYDPNMMNLLFTMIRPQTDSSSLEESTVMCNYRKEKCKCDRAYQYAKCVIQEEIKKSSS